MVSKYLSKNKISNRGRQHNTPWKMLRYCPGSCGYVSLPGKRDFAGVMKAMILIWGAQWNHKCPYKWKREVGESEREMWWQKQRSELEKGLKMLYCWLWRWRKGPQVKKCRQPLEARKGEEMHFPHELPEGMQACWHQFYPSGTILDFWSLELYNNKCGWF